jgi:uncharacterized protein (DUF427 family)
MSANTAPGYLRHPNHRVDIEPSSVHVQVEFNGEVVADTRSALLVLESRHDPVYYVPRRDVKMALLVATDHTSYCPFKGHARYWSIKVGQRSAENAVWAYDEPYDEAQQLQGYVAFYPDRVDRIQTNAA